DRFVGMELTDPAIDYVGLARSLGVAAERAKTVHDATDLIANGLKSDAPLLIDVPVDRNYKPVCIHVRVDTRHARPCAGRPRLWRTKDTSRGWAGAARRRREHLTEPI